MSTVKVYEKKTTIPTYGIGEADKNPMFYEKRVYQGSSGKVYPLPVIDKIYDEKFDQEYNAVYLENEYIKVMILPELGGRIQRAYDKTNNYDFVYYNQVIKPALVGLAGPWISGGIEFNWPQHHRPSTFSPIDYTMQEHEDGSCSVWCSEIDKMYGTKALIGFTLYPDKAYIEITGQLFNPTDIPQTFLWWANPAVAVNDYTKSIFPPDVHAVFDHGKRDVSEFPIAKGEYYKVDYSPGTDISRYKNIPVPTSYMAYHSDYNFVGGYDFQQRAGVLHVANHHISPGKKQWTWGNGEFGQAWDRHLTDEDGPYIELMTGVYTDNQPDFTWLESGEEKSFKQYFLPYKEVGEVKNATKEVLLGLVCKDEITCTLYTSTTLRNLSLVLTYGDDIIKRETIEKIDPTTPMTCTSKGITKPTKPIVAALYDQSGELILQYSENPNKEELDIPEAAKKSEDPQDITSNEELFLTGLHLEQYRHATYLPDPYYLEGLSRDPGDIRINNAYGLLLYRRGLYQESEFYFKKAKERLLWKNPNPYDGEVLYNLGLSLKMQGRLQEAYDAFYKSVWNDAIQGKGYFQLATIQARWQDYDEMLRLLDQSLIKGQHNLRARLLKSVALRKLGRTEKAIEWTAQTMGIDLLDCGALHETFLLSQNRADLDKMIHIMRSEPNSYLELAISYMDAGCYQEAINILQYDKAVRNYPMVQYYTAYSHNKLGNLEDAKAHYMKADKLDPSICFPNKLMSIKVLEDAIQTTPELPKAYYYLGNLFYDKLIHEKAITLWEQSRQLDSEFPTVHRNLGLAYYNKKQDYLSAKSSLERAYQLNKSDSRVFYELDQLYKRTNIPFDFRLKLMEDNLKTLCYRDDFYIEYVTVLNNVGQYQKAYDLLMKRQFHVWEGGEGRVVEQYIFALKHMAFNYMVNKDYANAISTLEKAKVYPHNLGEGKLINAQENDINYYLGVCHKQLGNTCYQDYFVQATKGTSEPTAAMFYNDAKPDSIYYQGFALLALDNQEQAEERFMKMIEYAATHINDHVRVDYFAISLPTFLIYHEDLQKSNKVHCHYLSALGHLGLGNKNKAQQHLSQAQQLDINHQGIRMIQNMFGL